MKNKVLWITTVFITLVLVFTLPLFFHVAGTIVDKPTPVLDLNGKWKVCFKDGDCINELVPHKGHPNAKGQDFHYLYYSKKFPTTPEILEVERSLIFTQISEASQIELNGTKIKTSGSFPPNFRYSAHYPVVATLSRDLLLPLGETNEIKISVYTTKSNEGGLRGELNGIFERVDAVRYQEGKLLYDITAPIFAALLLLALAYYALRVALKFKKLRKIFWSYLWATLAASLFLINYSKLTNEFLPAWLVTHVHFLFRNLMDWTLLYFFLCFYSREPNYGKFKEIAQKARKAIGVIGHGIYGFLTVLILTSLFIQAVFSDSSVQASLGASLPNLLSDRLYFLRLLPILVGVAGCLIDSREKLAGRLASALGMLFIAYLQLHDILSYREGATGIYFVKVFPLFIMYFYYTKINEVREEFITEDARIFAEAKTEVSIKKRVAHDLKHPILKLRALSRELPAPLKIKFSSICQEFSELNSSLSEKHEFSTNLEPTLISDVLGETVELAEITYPNMDFSLTVDPSAIGVFAKVNPAEFSHVVLNLINNAVESYNEEQGEVRLGLRLHPSSKKLELKVLDFGKGITSDIQVKLFKEGGTQGKLGGRGIGLFGAKRALENWNGHVMLHSRAGEGTSVFVSIPETPTPSHFLTSLDVSTVSELVIVADHIPQVLSDRLKALAPKLRIKVLKTIRSSEDYVLNKAPSSQVQFIVASSLKRESNFNGVEFCKKHHLTSAVILAENASDDCVKAARVERIPVLLASKCELIQIVTEKQALGHELHILVDNDSIIRKRWEKAALAQRLRFQSFSSIKSLRAELHMIPIDTKIFIDADISGKFDGVALASELQAKGFQVTLATGHSRHSLPSSAKGFKLIGKTPPWIHGVPV